jgi:polyphenol oxidase
VSREVGLRVVPAALGDGAEAFFTTRHGGVGDPDGPHGAANLARHVGEDEEIVTANRALLEDRAGRPVVFVSQVHSDRVVVVDDGFPGGGSGAVPEADALVTTRTDLALGIMTADCLPVLLADPAAGVVAAAHAGRVGLLDGVLERTLEAMAALGADPARSRASIGPAICGACYEVPAGMAADAEARLPGIRTATRAGTDGLDLAAGATAVLRGAGLAPSAIAAPPACTLEDDRFYSYRRSRRTGRLAGVVGLAAR